MSVEHCATIEKYEVEYKGDKFVVLEVFRTGWSGDTQIIDEEGNEIDDALSNAVYEYFMEMKSLI
ncbi:hypothetical protein [Peribacillus sp. Hz7]|uniref:hypothetical protein n=1 Tax=Peribacillus sp. Hz7 TaxID=3344873 RepID=UPI0035CC3412